MSLILMLTLGFQNLGFLTELVHMDICNTPLNYKLEVHIRLFNVNMHMPNNVNIDQICIIVQLFPIIYYISGYLLILSCIQCKVFGSETRIISVVV